MCGICGYVNLSGQRSVEQPSLASMTEAIVHRGPDSAGYFMSEHCGLGVRRLSLLDLTGGDQPLYSEDKSIVLVCNGEIFNYQDLRRYLDQKGHRLQTRTDVEVLIHLYEEYGLGFLNLLNGQFALALYDSKTHKLLLARDPSGICPLFYTVVKGRLVFGSEVKAILQHPQVPREVDLTGLDQVLTFPGLVSPRSMFKGINSLPGGHYLVVQDDCLQIHEYWDLDYPLLSDIAAPQFEARSAERLLELLRQSVKLRLQADVPVGLYLSGGLDSSLIAMLAGTLQPSPLQSFAIAFTDPAICEAPYRARVLAYPYFNHREIEFDWSAISQRLHKAVYHAECPLKETYNTASLALSESVKGANLKAVLTGEGADELFAGYVGYRFDRFRHQNKAAADAPYDLEAALEDELRLKVWGDKSLLYEQNLSTYRDLKLALYSTSVIECLNEFDCLNFTVVNKERLRKRHFIHQRSYLDFKLRLSDHLVADHGDRMALANSVEVRYPFLDKDLIEFARQLSPELKLKGLSEKYLLKEAAKGLLPAEIIQREKFAFHAPGSPYLLKQEIEWVNDLLSFDTIKRQGYFNPGAIERLKSRYLRTDFQLNVPFETDLLMIALTFGIFLEAFAMSDLV